MKNLFHVEMCPIIGIQMCILYVYSISVIHHISISHTYIQYQYSVLDVIICTENIVDNPRE